MVVDAETAEARLRVFDIDLEISDGDLAVRSDAYAVATYAGIMGAVHIDSQLARRTAVAEDCEFGERMFVSISGAWRQHTCRRNYTAIACVFIVSANMDEADPTAGIAIRFLDRVLADDVHIDICSVQDVYRDRVIRARISCLQLTVRSYLHVQISERDIEFGVLRIARPDRCAHIVAPDRDPLFARRCRAGDDKVMHGVILRDHEVIRRRARHIDRRSDRRGDRLRADVDSNGRSPGSAYASPPARVTSAMTSANKNTNALKLLFTKNPP